MALAGEGGLLDVVVVDLVVVVAVVVVVDGTTTSSLVGLVTKVTHDGCVVTTCHGGGNGCGGVESVVVDAGKHW